MSLATRCTACGTVFRVVQDQLRVSGGWVRCGRCGEVFNAVESLVDLEIDRPAEGAAPSAHGGRVMEDLARVARLAEGAQAAPAEAPPLPPVGGVPAPAQTHTQTPGATAVDVGSAGAAGESPASPPLGAAPETADDGPLPDAVVPALPAAEPVAAPTAPDPTANAPVLDDAAPGFLRQAERAARWRRPRVRAGLALLALLATAALLWQLTLVEHDLMAARWPALRPAIERVCVYGGCSVEPPRRIDSLTVESSGLVRAGPPDAYRLSLVLRNRERLAVRMPFVDLALTDAEGRLLARRVLEPEQLGARDPSIAAGLELPLAATLRVRDAPVVGYTIEIFYP